MKGAHASAGITGAGSFDFDCFGAVICEELGAEGPSCIVGQVQDSGPGEGLGWRPANGVIRHNSCANIAGWGDGGKKQMAHRVLGE